MSSVPTYHYLRMFVEAAVFALLTFAAVGAAEDGSIHKLVWYERAGCLVFYRRPGGDAPPPVTVTTQKLVN